MEYRKLISFGKSSFVISLPRSWITQHKLKKGDVVHLELAEPDLVLGVGQENQSPDKEVVISTDGKSLRRIEREIITAYIKNYKTITLIGKDLKDKAKGIQEAIHNLIALEVMEQTSSKLVAKDFLDMPNISVFEIIHKIDLILQAMFDDCERMFVEDNYNSIDLRDNDVNRLSFLLFRAVEFGLDNSSLMAQKYRLKNADLLQVWRVVFSLEAIGDDIKRISRYMRSINLGPEQKQQLLLILQQVKSSYVKIIQAFRDSDISLMYVVLENKYPLLQQAQQFYDNIHDVHNADLLTYSLRSVIKNVHSKVV